MKDIYERLGKHLSHLEMGYPDKDGLMEILKENFTPVEAEVALALPNNRIPLQPVGINEILNEVNLSKDELSDILDNLTEKKMLFCGMIEGGEKGYALQQVNYGFPNAFFWKGEDTPHARKMASLLTKYFDRKSTVESFSSTGRTKPGRFIPVGKTIENNLQAIYPFHKMERVIQESGRIAVAHCPCRMVAGFMRKTCEHPLEVCLKFDELADYVIERGIGRELEKDEALEIIKKSEKAGLIHFVENAQGGIKHCCNCCGCACWCVGLIKRRKIPRDTLVMIYFVRETDEDECVSCGECVEICPVDALKMEDDLPVVDAEWCIGCGVCTIVCPTGAVKVKIRPDREEQLPPVHFGDLHEAIQKEKGLK